MPLSNQINSPRNIDDFYYFLTVDKPNLIPEYLFVSSWSSEPTYNAYACKVYHAHLQAKFDYIALAAKQWTNETALFSLSGYQKIALINLAGHGQALIKVIKEINDQTTWSGSLSLPKVGYKFENDQSKKCLALLETVNSLLSSSRFNSDYNELVTKLTTQINEFKKILEPTWFDRLQTCATFLVGAVAVVAGVNLLITAAVGIFLAPSVMLLAIPGMWGFLGEVAVSAALFYPVGNYGLSTMSKSLGFFSQASTIETYKNEMVKPETAAALNTVRGGLFVKAKADLAPLDNDEGIKHHLSTRSAP